MRKARQQYAYIIPLDLFRYQRVHDQKGLDLVVNDGLPRQFFDAEIPTEVKSKYRIVEQPDWKFAK